MQYRTRAWGLLSTAVVFGFDLNKDVQFTAFDSTVELPSDVVNVIGDYFTDLQTSLSSLQDFQQPVPFSHFTTEHDFVFKYHPEKPQYYFKPNQVVKLEERSQMARNLEFTLKRVRGDCSALRIAQTLGRDVFTSVTDSYTNIHQTGDSFRIEISDTVQYSPYTFSLLIPDTCVLYLTDLTRTIPGDHSRHDLMSFSSPKPAILGFYSTKMARCLKTIKVK